jgi:Major royal jelly protein
MEVTRTINSQFPVPHLLFHPLSANFEAAVPLSVLNNRVAFEANPNAFADQFRVIGSRGVKTAAQAMDQYGNLFFVLWDPLAIVCWDSSTSYNRENIKVVYRNDETLQFASGVKVVKNTNGNEELWMITNRLQVGIEFLKFQKKKKKS